VAEPSGVNPIREALLWASDNRLLAERLPRLRFVRASVRRFMPGESLDDALAAGARLAAHGVPATLTYLGEHVVEESQADAVEEHYLGVLDEIATRRVDVEVSVKPTHLGLELDRVRTGARIRRLAERAAAVGTWVWLDMESAEHVQPTIQLYREVHEALPHAGICLQAYLHRTPGDVAELLPLDPSIRLVKGAYREPKDRALQDRASIDRRYLELALQIMRGRGERGRLALGSHDVDLLERVAAAARGEGLGDDRVEIQMLYGIREPDQVRLANSGRRVRTLIAYGTHWYAWYVRRLAEKPSNVWFVLRNLVGT
jgi:proline dehydrogenase